MNKGKITQIIGPVIDAEFEKSLPSINNAIEVQGEKEKVLVLEVAQHLGSSQVRCIAMGSTDGMKRGIEVVDTERPISVPVGKPSMGRMLDVLGNPIDGKGKINAKKKMPIHRPAPEFKEQSTETNVFETGIKVIDLIEQTGGSIVSEQFCGGVRHYDENVELNGDLLHGLAKRYLSGRAPGAFLRPSKQRLDLVAALAGEYGVDGVIWYQLRYCDTYNMEFFYFNTMMKKAGIPVLQLESEYDVEERGTLLNRIEGFMESLEGRAS